MIFFISLSLDKNLFFCLYDNEPVSKCLKKFADTLTGYKYTSLLELEFHESKQTGFIDRVNPEFRPHQHLLR
jgi:hypothetical protein